MSDDTERRLRRLEEALANLRSAGRPLMTPEDWHSVGAAGEPAFQNSWANYDTANFNAAGYYKDPLGRVWLRGLVKDGTGPVIFTLPAGYRPYRTEIHVCSSNSAYGEARVNVAGEVVFQVGSNTWISLDGITFRAA